MYPATEVLAILLVMIVYWLNASATAVEWDGRSAIAGQIQSKDFEEAKELNAKVAKLYSEGRYVEAIPIASRLLAIVEKAFGPEHPDVAYSLNNLAVLYEMTGDHAKAEQLLQRSLAIREKTLGPKHPQVVASLSNLATLYHKIGDHAKAEPLYQRALTIREKVLGPEHLDTAQSLNNLAVLYDDKGDYAKAEPLYQRALTIREKALGPEHPQVVASLSNLAVLYNKQGDYVKAAPLLQRVLTIREKALGQEHPDVAALLNRLGELYRTKGDYAKAEPLYRRALAIVEKKLGPEHPDTAQSLNNLGALYHAKGDYAKAEPLHQRALTIREKALGPGHPVTAQSLNNLAVLYYAMGDYARAEPLYQRALTIREKALGPEHSDVAISLISLATLYEAKGDYARAEPLYQRAIAIVEKKFGSGHPRLADVLNNLALLYKKKGDYVKAEQLLQRSLTIREKMLGPEHPDTAQSLNNLATLYDAKSDYMKAEPLLQRALAIVEKTLGPEHPNVAALLNSLARHYEIGDYTQAEPLYRRALAIVEKTLGPEHPHVAFSLSNLAHIYHATGNDAKAESLYQRALAIEEKALGPEHPSVADLLNNLAALYDAKGDTAKAIALQSRSNEITEHSLSLNLAIGSERQKLAYLDTLLEKTNYTVSLHIQSASNSRAACNLALETLLRRKGRSIDAMTDSIGALHRRLSPQDQNLLNHLSETSSRLATLALRGPQKTDSAQYLAEIEHLTELKEKQEAEISQRSAEFRAQSQPIKLEMIKANIPRETALIEFFVYYPYNAKTRWRSAERYVAYALRHKGEPTWVDLGEAGEINRAVAALREALRDRERTDVKQLARALDEKVMRPVRKLLGETRRVLISPDGALNLIPFAALVDEQNHYLGEQYHFTYLTSGRDLLRLQANIQSKQGAMIIANPDFDESAGGGQSRGQGVQPSKVAKTAAISLNDVYFVPLPGTAEEAQALKTMLPNATVLSQKQATEAALKQINSPGILHIATHGFFLEDVTVGPPPVLGQRKLVQQIDESVVPGMRLENPLLRSGLGLAGANLRKSGDEDGILTAMEASGLNLWGTKLVVLSACDTGVGEVKNGDGVYGLRRALVLAGSESQVMSLWALIIVSATVAL